MISLVKKRLRTIEQEEAILVRRSFVERLVHTFKPYIVTNDAYIAIDSVIIYNYNILYRPTC